MLLSSALQMLLETLKSYTILQYICIFLITAATEKKVKVTFDYEAQDEDELTLHVGDMIDFICEVEEGWWRGKLNGKIGVFPSNFVETIEVKGATQAKDKPVEIPSKLLTMLQCICNAVPG